LWFDRFHGIISRDDADLLLTADEDDDGRYLIRESQRAKEQYTLAIRCALVSFRQTVGCVTSATSCTLMNMNMRVY